MNLYAILLWGFAATIVLMAVTIVAQSSGLTRIDIPFILGTMVTADRDRAKVAGSFLHLLNGWVFALVYGVFFQNIAPTWSVGALMGFVQGVVVVAIILPLLPGVHPRMESDFRGPEPTRLLEPPGFLVTNYGSRTPVVLLVAHTLYGAIIGAMYVAR
jgi:hypothetical protein